VCRADEIDQLARELQDELPFTPDIDGRAITLRRLENMRLSADTLVRRIRKWVSEHDCGGILA
jgi:hypothetical protein